nr:probable N-acetyltransferase HLS1-like [Coffea arabica]
MAFEKIKIRSYDWEIDKVRVEDLERGCEVGPAEHVFLFTDTMGDPISRIRNSPMYNMLVAELNDEIIGVIQGSIKVVTFHTSPKNHLAKVGYILGLRVAPRHRRKGIALSLVHHMEEWFISHQVEYAYMATEKDNQASINLFVNKLGYLEFRTPVILVHPVYNRSFRLSSSVEIMKLKVDQAEFLYRKFMSSTEFFPHDINRVLRNKLSLGTWVAYFRRGDHESPSGGFGLDGGIPNSWAMMSVWRSTEVIKLRVGKPTLSCMFYAKSSRMLESVLPCFRVPSLPDFSENPFGFYFIYGFHREGPSSGKLVRTLCRFVHNLARESDGKDECKVIVTEVGGCDELKLHIPHWKLLSCPEDLWCIKALKFYEDAKTTLGNEAPPPKSNPLFVDPREV